MDDIIKDALGQPMELGAQYGHYQYANGISRNIRGICFEIRGSKRKVKLKVVEAFSSVYASEVTPATISREFVIVKANSLFRIVEN
jgi:hypothetical protein